MTQSFFHYTKTSFAKSIISTSKFKLSFAPKINDPFDLDKDFILDPDCNVYELRTAIKSDEELLLRLPNLHNIDQRTDSELFIIMNNAIRSSSLKSTISNTPFVSFSSKNDLHLLWAYYGDGYKGIALEFSGGFADKLQKVKYENFIKLPTMIDIPRLINLLKLDNKEMLDLCENFLIKKHIIWEHEMEHRAIFPPEISMYDKIDENYFLTFDLNSLSAIYIGLNFDQNDLHEIISLIKVRKATHVKFFEMKRKPGYFNLEFFSLNIF